MFNYTSFRVLKFFLFAVEELPKALSMDSGAWEKIYHFPKFDKEDTVVFQCTLLLLPVTG